LTVASDCYREGVRGRASQAPIANPHWRG
jgi:hypothetical protein